MKNNDIFLQSYLPKLKHFRFRKRKNTNFFLSKIPTFNKSNKVKSLSRNNSSKNKDDIKSSSSTKLLPLKLTHSQSKNRAHSIINSYDHKKCQNIKNNQNIRKIFYNNDLTNKLLNFNFKNINNNYPKLKVNHAVNTNNILIHNKKIKFNFRPISNKKLIFNFININDINEICFTSRKNPNHKFNKTLRDCFTERIKRDKYAYIYLSDNAESIKYSRRVNYNPLNV